MKPVSRGKKNRSEGGGSTNRRMASPASDRGAMEERWFGDRARSRAASSPSPLPFPLREETTRIQMYRMLFIGVESRGWFRPNPVRQSLILSLRHNKTQPSLYSYNFFSFLILHFIIKYDREFKNNFFVLSYQQTILSYKYILFGFVASIIWVRIGPLPTRFGFGSIWSWLRLTEFN